MFVCFFTFFYILAINTKLKHSLIILKHWFSNKVEHSILV